MPTSLISPLVPHLATAFSAMALPASAPVAIGRLSPSADARRKSRREARCTRLLSEEEDELLMNFRQEEVDRL